MRSSALCLVALACLALACAACDGSEFPVDPEETLTEIERERVLRVGVADHPPFTEVHDDGTVGGLEAAIVEPLARELGVELVWMPMAQSELVTALETRAIDLAVGGFDEKTPHKKKVGLSRPYGELRGKKYVLLVAPGENRWLIRVERYLHEQEEAIDRALMQLEQREARR